MALTLTPDQLTALAEILAARQAGERHLLTGYAGSGKTTLMQEVVRALQRLGLTVTLTAPTHKAVAVLSAKLREAGLPMVECRTIHSLLSLKPKAHSDRQIFVRDKSAKPVMADVVVIDECSMVGEDLMVHLRRHLPVSFVLFVGDPAQLPPVGEVKSQTFDIKSRSHLDTIVRQGAGNPVLGAAHAIRESQGKALDLTWCRSASAKPYGVFLPRGQADDWMQRAFNAVDFDANPDRFRYLAWTNARVAEVNQRIRKWRFGEDARTPFMPGERALCRAPIIQDGTTLFSTNEEAEVLTCARAHFEHEVEACGSVESWTAVVPSWRVSLRGGDGREWPVHMPAGDIEYNKVIARITDEATHNRERWQHLHEFKAAMARLQAIYAMTVHTSQGSTFENVFMDVPDIRRRATANLLETQQLFYVAATRPTHALMLVGVP